MTGTVTDGVFCKIHVRTQNGILSNEKSCWYTLSIKQNTLPSSLRIHRHKFLQKANKYGFTSIINYHKNHSQVLQNHITSVASFLTFNVICTPFLKFCNSLRIFATVIYSLKYLLISFWVFLNWKLLHIEKNAKEF